MYYINTKCINIQSLTHFKKLSENMAFIGLEVVQFETAISMSAITTVFHTTHNLTTIEITTCRSFSETIFIKSPVLFPKII